MHPPCSLLTRSVSLLAAVCCAVSLAVVVQQYQVVFEGEDPSKKPDKYLRKDGKAAGQTMQWQDATRQAGQPTRRTKPQQRLDSHSSLCAGFVVPLLAAAKYANEDTYVGEYRSGKRHGQGQSTHAQHTTRFECTRCAVCS